MIKSAGNGQKVVVIVVCDEFTDKNNPSQIGWLETRTDGIGNY